MFMLGWSFEWTNVIQSLCFDKNYVNVEKKENKSLIGI